MSTRAPAAKRRAQRRLRRVSNILRERDLMVDFGQHTMLLAVALKVDYKHRMRSWLFLVLLLLAGCQHTPKAKLADLGLSPSATYNTFLDNLVPQFKMRHQVESHFGDRHDVIEGFLVIERPGRFWVRAMAGFGTNLFDVRADPGRELVVQIHLKQLQDEKLARYLARDIRRVYLQLCPKDTAVHAAQGKLIVRCDLPASEQDAIEGDPVDTRVEIVLSPAAVLEEKRFFQNGQPTAVVHYKSYGEFNGHWLPQRIELHHKRLPYRFTIGLVSADLTFDAHTLFERTSTP